MKIPYSQFYFEEVGSTNDIALEKLENEIFVFISADFQNSGRGRNGKTWLGNKGENLYLSLGINHPAFLQHQNWNIDPFKLQSVASAILFDTLLENISGNTELAIKYPNDIYARNLSVTQEGKLSGIIVENIFQGKECKSSVLGIGINCNQTVFPKIERNSPVSLLQLEQNINIDNIRKSLIENFINLNKKKYEDYFQHYKDIICLEEKEIILIGTSQILVAKEILETGQLSCRNKSGDNIIVDNGDSVRYRLNYIGKVN
ncbi:MAG: hypothetical protein Kapaf2KO_07000 [Candidatus Kapaibacteriales bacterium]